MASKDITNPVDINNPSNTRRTADLLPGYHRTDKNIKFLASTLDQFIQEPQLERLDGFVGSKLSLNYNPSADTYIDGGSALRNAYQLEPSMVIKDANGTVTTASGYDDLINQLNFNNANTTNLDRLFRPKSFAYDPGIDWDKFVNFRQYYWMPTGPDSIEITGQQQKTISTYTVKEAEDGNSLTFTPDGLTPNPALTLYRGQTYVFNVTTKKPFYIKTAYVAGAVDLFNGASNQGTKKGQVILTIDDFTPKTLFYFAEGNDNAIGQFIIKSLAENTVLDIENEIVGKATYRSGNGVEFTNGMKVHFVGAVTPSSYIGNEYIVEGVGTAIKLVDFNSLKTVGLITTNLDVNFDATPFDKYPFDDFQFVPLTPDYVTINRASPDLNSWSRYNRWVHADVIAATAAANKVPVVYPSDMRAQRPIIEFNAGMQLFNFGAFAKNNIDLIDTVTPSAFKTVEGSSGFYIDGVLVEQGFRVIFNADTDPDVKGKIYQVKFVVVNNKTVINLEEAEDSIPSLHNAVVSVRGNTYGGCNWWYNGTTWIFAQQKTALNQAPLFDVYDDNGVSYSDQTVYSSSFSGTKIFGYAVGTGTADPILGFPLQYKNVNNVGDYLFNNYFMTDTFSNFKGNNIVNILPVAGNYLKVNSGSTGSFRDIWTEKVDQQIPIIQFQVIESNITYIQINAIDNPGFAKDLKLDVFVNDTKKITNVDYIVTVVDNAAYVVSTTTFNVDDRVLIKLYTKKTPNTNGYYEAPINLTNNPLNGSIENFTFTEVSDHVKTIVDSNNSFSGVFPGASNLRDLPDISKYGSRLVSHQNPISFAHYFLGLSEHNLVEATRKVATDYNQFKTSLLKHITDLKGLYSPTEALDTALVVMNGSKDNSFPYTYSDMIAYGKDYTTRKYTVANSRHTQYSLESIFDTTVLDERAVLVYLNNTLLVKDRDYVVEQYMPSISILVPLVANDTIIIKDYSSTVGSYVPPTPTKLGLYPKFTPSIFVDNTYVGGPQTVIQGHDGSLTVAFNDYRDAVLLEYETRIYNNLKVNYNSDLLDINSIMPGAFRNTDYTLKEVTQLLTPDFLKWTGFFGVDYQTNSSFNELNSFTFNYSANIDSLNKNSLPGYWRGIYKYFYDTDRPHTHPWEMLGFTEMPAWWETVYGPAPYTSGNQILWEDLELGRNANTGAINTLYARPGLNKIIPVDGSGNLKSPTDTGLATTPIVNLNDPHRLVVLRSEQISSKWRIGDCSPAETAWRRSSYWPFVCQIIASLTNPATYSASLFDTSRMKANKFGEYKYSTKEEFLNPANVILYRDTIDGNRVLATGYSVFVIETGINRNATYLTGLKSDLAAIDYNLMVKLGGFASKDKLQVTIDAVDPTSPYPGVLVPSEDYQIFFNQSTPVESLNVSGMIIQKTANGYAIRGYDKYQPYFTILKPFASNADQTVRVGGISESFVNWTPNTIYSAAQIVFYNDRYYRVIQKHNSSTTFDLTYYQSLPYLPTVGGVGVFRRTAFDDTASIVPYGVEYTTIQEVYDLIVGYGQWLLSKGFIFDEYNNTLDQILDWNFTAKEFLYWTTQNWMVNSVITLSPFANKLIYRSSTGVVDSIVNNFYEYSLLKADGGPFPKNSFSIVRLDGEFTLSTINTTEGIFFARLNVVQKEHAVVFNNYTLFNDVVYDISSGYRQRRVNLKGFRTAGWNGDFFSPGFVFDQANITDWQKFVDYGIGTVVRFSGKYYTAPKSITGTESFNLDQWVLLNNKPVSQLMPNFDYKINQFEDFYSLDIDNFDAGQQAMAQHLTGYTPRPYLNNIIGDPIAQYKFYQGYIREKGTRNPLTKLSKSSLNNFQSSIDFNEEWAFRIGYYGGYNTYQELETQLESTKFIENPQIIEFVENKPAGSTNAVYYKDAADIIVAPQDFDISAAFPISAVNTSTFALPIAGYVRFDDVTATAYNKNSVLDIANNKAIIEGNTIWLGFREDGEWDVLRATQVPTIIIGVAINVPGQSLQLATYYPHQLSVGELISVSRVASTIDQCYIVLEILDPNRFVVSSKLTSLPAVPGTISGLLFTFKSSRISEFDDLVKIPYPERWSYGEKAWADSDGTGKWAVYQKTDNYQSLNYNNTIDSPGQHFGYKVVADDAYGFVASAAVDYADIGTTEIGRVFVLTRGFQNEPNLAFSYSLNSERNVYHAGMETGFGSSMALDGSNNLLIAGAPKTSNVKSTTGTVHVSTMSSALAYVNQGIVKLSLLDFDNAQEKFQTVITTPSPVNTSSFGASIVYQANNLFVGAPGENKVYAFNLSVSTTSIIVNNNFTSIIAPENLSTGTSFGYAISANANGIVAVAAPGFVSTSSNGAVYVYNLSSTSTYIQQITGDSLPVPMGGSDIFGLTVALSQDGNYLVVGSPVAFDSARGSQSGVVDIFAWNANINKFVFQQRLHAPITSSDISFGQDISINEAGNLLVVSSLGNAQTTNISFDKYSTRLDIATSTSTYGSIYVNDSTSAIRAKQTTFDSGSTRYHSKITNAGAVHTYIRKKKNWVFAQEIYDNNVPSNSQYGKSVFATNNSIYVGAPGSLPNGSNNGEIFIFDKKDTAVNGWALFRNQEPSVDLSLVNRSITIDATTEQVQDYIDIIDPLKGKILGTAKQELKYTTAYDPAIYSLGVTGVNVNSSSNWLDEHVGELWWDLSTVKYVWYEQGELEYRKNNWNNIFPGSTIDVYEWVRSEYLPAEWSQLADTADGLTRGISGQPKFRDNSVISVKQVYNSVSNSFSNVYYYWVKNKVVVPTNVPDRRMAAFEVAQQIADPIGSGSKFLALIGPSSAMLANAKSLVGSDQINLNIAFDYINDAANRHTEWLLLQENDANSRPNWLLEKKLLDSLLGHDDLGNPVPDPALPSKLRYGVEIRPRQGLFVDRFGALRNIVEFANSTLTSQLITDRISFDNLNAKDAIPPATEYDISVEDIYSLELIPTKLLSTAVLEAGPVPNGKLTTISIVNNGYGYLTAPTIEVIGDGVGAVVKAVLNSQSQVVSINVVNAGSGYSTPPQLIVRPFTAVVKTDVTVGGKWAVYTWSPDQSIWVKSRTQDFDTTQYWKYIDWSSVDYDPLRAIATTVASPYALTVLQYLPVNTYVKVQNGGDGRYLILNKTDGKGGTFDNDWNLVYSQNGTIQFLDVLWNLSGSIYAWDEQTGFDQTEYDQSPDKEISYILLALKDDIFVNERKIYWNQLFFKAVKYALTEQKFLDWAFKTTFISVINNAGSLDQRHTYKLRNSADYESFLNEIKPYHTKVRRFKESYTSTEVTRSFTTDFDLPPYYNTATLNFSKVEFGNPNLLQYPWKSWYNNYSYSVETIEVYNGGSGYSQTPTVTIVPAPGDKGHGATAVAYISLGKVSKIIVTNPGSGYTATPTVVINGGGSTILTAARAVARLGLNNVRHNTLAMKFDRVGSQREIGLTTATNTFIGDGEALTFPLLWTPLAEKSLITLKVDGVLQLIDTFTIEYKNADYSPQPNTTYTKQYATLRLNFIPATGQVITIEYPKSVDLYTAIDRIQDFYEPTSGMPGKDPRQLMTGLEYSGLQVDALPFNSSGGWNVIPYGTSPWDNYSTENGYFSVITTATTTQTFTLTNMIISTGTEVNVYVKSSTDASISGTRIDNSIIPTLIGLGTGAVDYIEMLSPGLGYVPGKTNVTISAPNSITGSQARAIIDFNPSNDGSIIVSIDPQHSGSGYTEAPTVTITGPTSVQAYAKAVLKAEFLTTASTVTQTSIVIPANVFGTPDNSVVFRYANSDGTVLPTDEYSLDSVISGGDLGYTTALGVTPTEIILDGGSTSTRFLTGMNDDGFLNPINSAAPEECVPGQIRESVGISVYTQPENTAPVIINKKYWVDGTTLTFKLGAKPSNTDSVIAIFNNTTLDKDQYSIDYAANTFTFSAPNPGTGWLNLTTVQLGTVQLLDYSYQNITITGTSILSTVVYGDIGSDGLSTYVTIDGIPAVRGVDYILGNSNYRAQFTFYKTGNVQTYLFRGPVKSFSEINEQVTTCTTATSTIALNQPPGVLGPFHSQVIVTKNGVRLNPPVTTYYQVEAGQLTYNISESIHFSSRSVDILSIEIYINGKLTPPARAWRLNQKEGRVSFTPGVLNTGDVIAIVVKVGNEYLIENDQLVLSTPTVNGDIVRITTFTNHDPDFIRTERYLGYPANRYKMQRAVLDSSYVWVTYNGTALTANVDYSISTDGYFVMIRKDLYQSPTDSVVITSFAKSTSQLTAYRIFKDMLGRTHYKRLSSDNVTALSRDLLITDETILVQDASVLSIPNIASNTPGIVLINGERIEFFTVNGNELGQLRRGTLGTMPKQSHPAGSEVVDQGVDQTMPFVEYVQSYSTVTTTSTELTFDLRDKIQFNTSTVYTDQVEVYYGGIALVKPGANTVAHDFNSSYDSTATEAILSPGFTITGTTLVLSTTSNFVLGTGVQLKVISRNSRVFGDENSPEMKFLKEKPAALPIGDISYSEALTLIYIESGLLLTDENDNPLEGI
jgi:hypothetical protein